MKQWLAVACIVTLSTAAAHAQDSAKLVLSVTRPDSKVETLRGRRLDGVPATPTAQTIRPCGSLDIALRKVQYSASGYFSYYFLVRRSNSAQWEEWLLSREDEGRFASQRVDAVKVFLQDPLVSECNDFRMPLYCIASCSDSVWWAASAETPKSITIYLGPGGYLSLLLKKQIPFPAKITAASLSMSNSDLWDTSAVLGPQPAPGERELDLRVVPRFAKWKDVLLEDNLLARITYNSEVDDNISEGVALPGEITLPATVKPYPWVLPIPVIVACLVGAWIRQRSPKMDTPIRGWGWLWVSLIALLVWTLGYGTGSSFELATFKVSADGLRGAIAAGLATGLAGPHAVDYLKKWFPGLP